MQLSSAKPRFEELRPGRPGTRHLTYHLGGGPDENGTYYTLLRDGKILYVQAKPIVGPNFVNRGPAETNKAYNSLLTSIQILLDDIEFGRGDWLYLLRNGDGSDRLIYRRKPLVISNFLWAPLIDEIEIEITRWGIYGTREGWWNGREVDLYEPTLPSCASLVEWQNEGYLIMQRAGLNGLVFQLLGHLVRDGVVVGNVFEASHGRLVEFSDRAAVYDAVARIQRQGVIYRDIASGEIFITDTGVRFGGGVSSVILVEDKKKLEEEAEFWHWGKLERLFNKLKDAPFNNAWWTRKMSSMEVLIPRLPSPSRPLPIISNFSQLTFVFALFTADPMEWLNWFTGSSESSPHSRLRKRLTASPDLPRSQRRRLPCINLVIDEPLALSSSRVRLRLTSSHHPYSRSSSRRVFRDDVTETSDTSDSTL
ncbi:hypothetical protein PILCRDRAFT_2217 [Piloderma croceum F 1598]|uniref:Uncharacterized protein n=1 Tax=Piloderma croceum (strain F 1598) TaxID=765440 RepID=A0A0C3CJN8_PILCF|nr:hypothetical protein PILCRDRAFT_2217 [Piloderma croceum F 1598]